MNKMSHTKIFCFDSYFFHWFKNNRIFLFWISLLSPNEMVTQSSITGFVFDQVHIASFPETHIVGQICSVTPVKELINYYKKCFLKMQWWLSERAIGEEPSMWTNHQHEEYISLLCSGSILFVQRPDSLKLLLFFKRCY